MARSRIKGHKFAGFKAMVESAVDATAICAADADVGMDSMAVETEKFKAFADRGEQYVRDTYSQSGREWSAHSLPNYRNTYRSRRGPTYGKTPPSLVGGIVGHEIAEGSVESIKLYIMWCNGACNGPPGISDEFRVAATRLALVGFFEHLCRNFKNGTGLRKTAEDRRIIRDAFLDVNAQQAWANVGEFVGIANDKYSRGLYQNITAYPDAFLGSQLN